MSGDLHFKIFNLTQLALGNEKVTFKGLFISTMVSLSFTIRCQNTCVPNWKDYKKELLESSVQTLITKTL